jgi:carboxymethylenebutenolidase
VVYGARNSTDRAASKAPNPKEFLMSGTWIDLGADGGKFEGYLALPPTGSGPGIVLIQEIFGVNHHIRGVADQYALDGYVVLAPDLYWRARPHIELGYTAETMGEGFGYLTQIGFPALVGDTVAAAKALRARPEVTGKIASIGFCAGGTLSYLAAAEGAVDAMVYYGGGTQNLLDKASKVTVPALFHFGGEDSHIPAEAAAAVQKAFEGHPNASFHVHPGAQHGFNCWARGSYNQKSAAIARSQTLAFLAANL